MCTREWDASGLHELGCTWARERAWGQLLGAKADTPPRCAVGLAGAQAPLLVDERTVSLLVCGSAECPSSTSAGLRICL